MNKLEEISKHVGSLQKVLEGLKRQKTNSFLFTDEEVKILEAALLSWQITSQQDAKRFINRASDYRRAVNDQERAKRMLNVIEEQK